MKIEQRPLASIKPYEHNPRLNDAAVDAVAESIKRFGFRQPIVVDSDGVIVVGHTRWKAAQKLGLNNVPVHVAKELTPEQAKAYRVADNQTATLAAWDLDLLKIELTDLQALNVDLNALGFSADELASILDPGVKDGLCDPDAIPEPPDKAITQPDDFWVLGDHRLLCADSSSAADVDRLLDGAPIHLVNTDPPYNVKVEPRSNNAIAAGNSSFSAAKKRTHHQSFDVARQGEKKKTHQKLRPKDRQLLNDFVTDEAFDKMLHAWFGNIARVLAPGRGFYIWGGYANCGNYPPVLKACGLYFSQSIIWDKQHPVLTRKDFMGAHEWCQPKDTQVLTPDGVVTIGSLRDGDRVVAYSPRHNGLRGMREGWAVRTTSRPYCGTMHGVRVGQRMTWCTPGHLWTVKLSPMAASYWCVYLMRRGSWWRVGKSKLLSTWGFGIKQRLYTEDGDAVWLLSVHRTNVEATIAEQLTLAHYGIPTTTWSESAKARRTLADVGRLYEQMDLSALHDNAVRLLADHGRSLEFPVLRRGETREKLSRRVSTTARACNLVPNIMMIPIPDRGHEVRWCVIDAVDRSEFKGDVFSMDVERYGHYIADGLVTHNCFYGWKEGAAHVFLGPNNVPDLWHVKKINPNQMEHLTQKSVELAVRAIQYSSRAGENVLDLFGGSGSTLIAAEQTGRKCFMMELDPLYADTIVDRFQRFSGTPGILERTGTSPIPMKPREENMR